MRNFVQNLVKRENRLRVCRFSKLWVLLLAALLFQIVVAQEANHKLAEAQIAADNFSAAENTYSKILENNPLDLNALQQRAVVRSWQGKQSGARNDFRAVLAVQPENLSALTGLGYSLAWAKDFDGAQKVFGQALNLNSENKEAKKGLAFVALWSGQSEDAVARFRELQEELPRDDEIAAMLGQAYLEQGAQGRAREALHQSLALNPNRLTARNTLQSLRFMPSLGELNLWSGYSSAGSENTVGLRSVEIAAAISNSARLWAGYDNSLSLDNPILIRDKDPIPSYYGGAVFNAGNYSTTKIQYGWRDLNEAANQHLILLEEVLYPSAQFNIKLGSFIGLRTDDRSDFSLYGGIGLLPSTNFSLEPVFFYTRVNQFDEDEWRVYMNSEYRFAPEWRVSGGLGFGNVNSSVDAFSGALAAGHLQLGVPLASRHVGFILARYEDLPNQTLFTFALGLKLRMERR